MPEGSRGGTFENYQLTMNLRTLTTLSVAATCGLLLACTNSSSKFVEEVERAVGNTNAHTLTIDLAALTDFSWSRLVIFPPYTPLDRIDRQLGQPWPEAKKTQIQASDTFYLLVFLQGNVVVEHVKFPRTLGDFEGLQQMNDFGRSNALFKVSRRADRLYFQSVSAPASTK